MSATRGRPLPASTLRALQRLPEPGSELEGYVRLHRNERLEPLPDWFVERLRDRVSSELLLGYPVADAVYGALARTLAVDRSQLLLTPGSDGAVKGLFHAFVEPGDRVVMLDPSYAMYTVYAEMFSAESVRIPYDTVDGIDVGRIVDAVVDGVKLVLITNPNQPTGSLMPEDDVVAVVERAAEVGALVAVDEAYFPFSGMTVLPRIRDYPNLAVTRTFSKAAGFAGLRIGYIAADATVVEALFKVRSVHDVNAFAMACVIEVLENPSVVDDYVAQVHEGGRVLAARMAELDLRVPVTYANFALVEVADRCSPELLIEHLRARGYLVRGPFTAPVMAPYVRVTLGPPDLMEAFCDVFAEVLATVDAERAR